MDHHYQHNDDPHDGDPARPGRHCGPGCDLYQPPEREERYRTYTEGYDDGQADAQRGQPPRHERVTRRSAATLYRLGYSDGYRDWAPDAPAGAGESVEASRG